MYAQREDQNNPPEREQSALEARDLVFAEAILPAIPPPSQELIALTPAPVAVPDSSTSLISELLALNQSLPSLMERNALRIYAAASGEHAALFWSLCQGSAACHELIIYRDHFNETAALGDRVKALGAAYFYADLVLRDPLLAEETVFALSSTGTVDARLLDRIEQYYVDHSYLAALCARVPGTSPNRTGAVETALLRGALEPYFALSERSTASFAAGISAWCVKGDKDLVALKSAALSRRERLFLERMVQAGVDVPAKPPQFPAHLNSELKSLFEENFDHQRGLFKALDVFLDKHPRLSDGDYRFILSNIITNKFASQAAYSAVVTEVNRIKGAELWSAFNNGSLLADNIALAFKALQCVSEISDPETWLRAAQQYKQLRVHPAHRYYRKRFLASIEECLGKQHTQKLADCCPKFYYAQHPELAPPLFPKGINKELRQIVSNHYLNEPELFKSINAWLRGRPALKDLDLDFLAKHLGSKMQASKDADIQMALILDEYFASSWSTCWAIKLTENCPLLAKALACVESINDSERFRALLPKLLAVTNLPPNLNNDSKFMRMVETYFKRKHAEKLCELSPAACLDETVAKANDLLEAGVDRELQKLFIKEFSEASRIELLHDFLDRRAGNFSEKDAAYLLSKLDAFTIRSKDASDFMVNFALQSGRGYGWEMSGSTPEACVLAIRAVQSVRRIEDKDIFQALLAKVDGVLTRERCRDWPGGFRHSVRDALASKHQEKLRRLPR